MAWLKMGNKSSKQSSKQEKRTWKSIFSRKKNHSISFENSTPQSTPESSPTTKVPINLPKEYIRLKTICVGGKEVPFTRKQVLRRRNRIILYEVIQERDE